MGKRNNFQRIGCGEHGGGNACGCGKPRLSMTPEEINALLDRLEEILNNGGQPSPSPSPMPAEIEMIDNKVQQIRPYVDEEGAEETAETEKYPSERAVSRALYLIDQYVGQVERNGRELEEKVGSLEYFEERYILPEEVLPLSSFSVGGIMEALYKLIKKNAIAIANIGEQIAGLQQQINVLAAQITGITINVSPQSLTVGEAEDVVINITTSTEADSVSLYRNGSRIYSSDVPGTEWEYTDTFTPDTAGEVVYNAVVVVGHITKENAVSIPVVEDVLESITWSGGSISSLTVPVGGTATLTKGTVTAHYTSGRTENVTNEADFVTNGDGYIEGTTYHPRSTAGPEDIFPRFGGKSATNPIMVMVTEQRLDVVIGHGRSYSGANFEDMETPVHDDLDFEVEHINNGDYIFIKVDKRDEVRNLYLHNDNGGGYTWVEIPLDIPQDDGDYKYYQTDMQFNAYNNVEFRINKT